MNLKNHTTAIGSMPHTPGGEALEALKRFPLSIPVWPQLPKRSFKEAMVPQYCEGFPGIRVAEENKRVWVERDDALLESMASFFESVLGDDLKPFAISPEHAQGLHAFLEWLGQQNETFAVVKGQVTGPFTFGLTLNDNDGKAVWFDEQYREAVVKGLAKKALWQIELLRKHAREVVIFFDEPIFSALGTPAYMGIEDEVVLSALDELAESVHAAGAWVGVHCCGNMDWGLLARSAIDIISFDAYSYAEKVALYPEAINGFLDRGGHLAWGIVPTIDADTVAGESAEGLKAKLDGLLGLFEQKGIAGDRVRNQMLLTPSCGTGTLPPDSAETVFGLLQGLRELVVA